MWYLSIKNWLIIILLVIGVAVSGLYLWQRITVVNQKNTIGDLQVLTADLQNQIVDYKANIATIKKVQKEHQKITNDAATLMSAVNKLKETKCIGGKDEKIISDITYFFNSHGLLDTSSSKTSGEVLPITNTTDSSGWSVKQIIENYLVVIDYALKIEKTVNCYETDK